MIGLPSSSASPRVGLMKPATMLSSVDLPQPEGPMSETNSPGCTLSETSLDRLDRAVVAPKIDAHVADVDETLVDVVGCVDDGHRLLPGAKASHGITRTPTKRMMPLHTRPSTPIVIMPSTISG